MLKLLAVPRGISRCFALIDRSVMLYSSQSSSINGLSNTKIFFQFEPVVPEISRFNQTNKFFRFFQLGVDGYVRNYEEYRNTLKGVFRPILRLTKTAFLDFRKFNNSDQESNPLVCKKSHPVLLRYSIVLLKKINFWEVTIYGKLKKIEDFIKLQFFLSFCAL